MNKQLIIRIVLVLCIGYAVNESTRLHELGHFAAAQSFNAAPVTVGDQTSHVYTHNPSQEAIISKMGIMGTFYICFFLGVIELIIQGVRGKSGLPIFACVCLSKVFDVVDYLKNGNGVLNYDDLSNIAHFTHSTRAVVAGGLMQEIILMSAGLIAAAAILHKYLKT